MVNAMKVTGGYLLLALVAALLSPGRAVSYEVTAVSNGGSIVGKVKFNGTPPPNKRLLITKDFEICGKGEREIPEVVVSKDGALQEVVAYIEKIDKGKAWGNPHNGEHVLDQKGCRFIPYLQVVPKGAELQIRNNDPVLHNIHVREIMGRVRRTMFNFGQPDQGKKIPKMISTIRNKEIKIECEAHNFMHGWMFAAENPYYAVTGEDGTFRIENVPPGSYKVKAWHPILGIQEGAATVSAGGKAELSFQFSAK